ncbi:hypothetical protein FQN50_006966 [Emmonsiellopsis sp. PD_5]|nr:hypothetical protein FQN50_006966 [Emmonsiellopsis sp. PD_5]
MAYYDNIKTRIDYLRLAASEQPASFSVLAGELNCQTAASLWGREHLFACRVVCSSETDFLPLLAGFMPSDMDTNLHPRITNLIAGPGVENSELNTMTEPEIIQSYENGGIGYIWAALAPLLRSTGGPAEKLDRPSRARMPRRPSTGGSSRGSIGYVENPAKPLAEDFTVRLLSCMIRSVLNYAQPSNKGAPFLQYRDERLGYTYAYRGKRFEAIDDGGIQLMSPDSSLQVALLEAKRSFQVIDEGHPTVSDEFLGQVVGEALAARRSGGLITRENVVSILAVGHYVKFIHLSMPDEFNKEFDSIEPTERNASLDTYLHIFPTKWFNVATSTGRKHVVRHLLALIAWADGLYQEQTEDDPMDD